MSGRALVRAAWTLALALVAILLLKVFVCDVYHVDSGSMEPTMFGSPQDGESVLVLYGRAEPERFDIVVLQREGEAAPLVKRVAGLPRETAQIVNGDLLVNGSRLPASAPRPPPVPVFDDRWQRVEEWFDVPGWWKREGGEWRLDASSLPEGSPEPFLRLRPGLRDDYLTPDHAVAHGEQSVNDAIVECEILVELRGEVVIELLEQGDVFQFHAGGGGSECSGRIARRSEGMPDELLAQDGSSWAHPHAWLHVRCGNVDNTLTLEILGGSRPILLTAGYAENRFDKADRLKEGRSFGSRVRIGGEGALRLRRVRILRDLFWTARGGHGVGAPQDLGPDECFLLGDNSAHSRDSREWGPVRLAQILGRPTWVVWPPSRIRPLEPRVEGRDVR